MEKRYSYFSVEFPRVKRPGKLNTAIEGAFQALVAFSVLLFHLKKQKQNQLFFFG